MMDERLTDLERQFCEVNDLRVQHFADLMKTQAENARLRAQLEAVRKVATEEMDNLGVGAYFARSVLAALSNEGGGE